MANLIGTNPDQVPTNGLLGTAAFIDKEQFVARIGSSSESANGNAGASRSIVWAAGQWQSLTLDQNTSLSFDFSNAPVGNYTLKISQDATGSRTITWGSNTPGTTRWQSVAGAPVLNTAAGSVSFANIYWDGSNAWGLLTRVNAP